jgi:hypothetical protein
MLHRRLFHFFFAVVFALLLSAVLPTVARADETPPPETPTTIVGDENPPPANEEEAINGDENIIPQTQEEISNDNTVPPDEQGAPPPAASNGGPLLASGSLVNPGDSFWCPAGQPALPGENGCTATFGAFTDLLGFLLANETDPLYQQAGVIYVAMGNYAGGETEINFSAFSFVNLSQYDLSLQGGWNPGAAQIGPEDRTTFTIPITIGVEGDPWRGALMVSNINIHGVAQDTALTLVSQSDVTVVNVQVSDNRAGLEITAGGDVVLENVAADENRAAGATIAAGGDVTVTASTFNHNGAILCNRTVTGYGLYVTSDGDVALIGVQANRNHLYGTRIWASGSVSVGQSEFSENRAYTCSWCGYNYTVYGYGLQVENASDVTLIGVAANRNYLYGASIKSNGWVLVVDSSFSNNRFDRSSRNQVGYGLNIVSGSYVTLSRVQANDNSLYGATIQAAGDVAISTGGFSGHRLYSCSSNYECGGGCTPYGYGLKVTTAGNIYLYQVTADRNALYGAYLKANGDVFVYEGSFSQNAFSVDRTRMGYGLEIISGGTVGLTGVSANANNLYGARIQATGDVSVFGSSFSNNQSYSGSSCSGYSAYGYGLRVTAGGNIQLDGVQANQNHLYGAWLQAGSNVSVNNSSFSANAFTRSNSLQVGYGLKIVGGGFVSLAGIQASNNRLFGADVQAVGDVSIATASFSGHDLYTCSTNYECGGCTPYGYGLKVVTRGDIYLYGVTAEVNVLYGAYLKTNGSVYITSSNFSRNAYSSGRTRDGYGLQVISGANVWLWDVQADGNNLFGAKVQAVGNVTIEASHFSDNRSYSCSYCGGYTVYGYGLQVSSKGDIRLVNVLADGNHLYGASLKADGDLTIIDSDFSDNRFNLSNKVEVGYGLNAVSGGNVMLTNVTAYDNSLYGAFIQAVGDVTIADSAFAGHLFYKCTSCGGCVGGYGLQVIAGGSITLNYVSAEDNALYGARLVSGGDIVVLGGVFSNNVRDYGLSATAGGAVDLSSVIAFGNGSSGAIVSAQGPVTVTGGLYKNNGQRGLSITTSGNVVLDGLTAQANGSHGVFVQGNCCISVYVNDGVYVGNGGYGLKVVNGALFQSGSPVFSNNSLGSIFVDGGLCNARPPSNKSGCARQGRSCRR